MTITSTRSGKVEGFEKEGVEVFLGIPYAAPPVGELRWKMPQPEVAWDGVRDAKEFSAQSAQTEFAMNAMMGAGRPAYSEDSLYLNVWTPACDDKRRAVMVWIHGGAFIWGAGDTPWYHGTQFAKNADVVVVTINYRLGPFGFMHLGDAFPELAGSGNLGIMDQVAALEWVRDSIGAFGGDPDRVTIFGESAGGASVGTLLGTPSARGLFHRAIAQSGAASWYSTPEQANAATTQVLERAGVRAGDLDALMALSTDAVLDAQPTFVENGTVGLPFQPVVDGIGLPQPPLDAIRAGNAEGVHLIVGTNAHEMTLFIMMDPTFGALDDDAIRARVAATNFGLDGAAVVDDYRRRRPDATAQELWLAISTDAVFRIPAILTAMAQQGHGPVWSYLFTYETPVFGGVLRSTHALEIPFVFDTVDQAAMFCGTGPALRVITDAMHGAWGAFARTGDPNFDRIPEWPQYEPARRATMRFDATCEVLDDPGRDDREAFTNTLG